MTLTAADGEVFTDADRVAMLAIENGAHLEPWQFDFLDRLYRRGPGDMGRPWPTDPRQDPGL